VAAQGIIVAKTLTPIQKSGASMTTAKDISTPGLWRSLWWLGLVYCASVVGYTVIMFFIARAAGSQQAMAKVPGYAFFLTNAAGSLAGLGVFALLKWRFHHSFLPVIRQEWGPLFRWPAAPVTIVLLAMTGLAVGSDWYLLEYQRVFSPQSIAGLSSADAAARLLAVLLRTFLITLLIYGSLVRSLLGRSTAKLLGIMTLLVLLAFGLRYGYEAWHQFADPAQFDLALRFVTVRLLGWLLTGLGAAVAYKETTSLGPAAAMLLAYQMGEVLMRLWG